MENERKRPKKADPIDTIVECIWDFNEAQYEDTDMTDDDMLLAKRRFRSALQYLIVTTTEEYNAKKQV